MNAFFQILSNIFLRLDPPDLETSFLVCTEWRRFIERHLLGNEITLARDGNAILKKKLFKTC
jgi:hypothetical protein